MGFYGGMRIVADENMVDTVEDWSKVRSPGRARRRLKCGHRQNIVYRRVPKKEAYMIAAGVVPGMPATLVAHPDFVAKLAEAIPAAPRWPGFLRRT